MTTAHYLKTSSTLYVWQVPHWLWWRKPTLNQMHSSQPCLPKILQWTPEPGPVPTPITDGEPEPTADRESQLLPTRVFMLEPTPALEPVSILRVFIATSPVHHWLFFVTTCLIFHQVYFLIKSSSPARSTWTSHSLSSASFGSLHPLSSTISPAMQPWSALGIPVPSSAFWLRRAPLSLRPHLCPRALASPQSTGTLPQLHVLLQTPHSPSSIGPLRWEVMPSRSFSFTVMSV